MSIPPDDYPSPKPLSVTIPKSAGLHGPYCPRRPNLGEILANTSESPWTLAAFMAYLSNNHCLETLEFTMDAGRYKKHYAKMMTRAEASRPPPRQDREYVQALWQRLLEAYIQPNGSREVNLPSDVRDPLLRLTASELPPAPESLDAAVAKTYELMEESVLVPFLNSVYPQAPHSVVSSHALSASNESLPSQPSLGEEPTHPRRKRHARSSPPPQTSDPQPHSAPAANRKSAPSSFTSTMNRARLNLKSSPTTSSPHVANFSTTSASLEAVTSGSDGTGSAASGLVMTDDTGSTGSPLNESPMTPPTSPPTSDSASSPKRDSGMWKKLGRLSGVRVGKKRSGGLKEEPQQ